MDWYGNATLHNTPMTNMTINGTVVAAVQNVDNFSFALVNYVTCAFSKRVNPRLSSRVYGAGHELVCIFPKISSHLILKLTTECTACIRTSGCSGNILQSD